LSTVTHRFERVGDGVVHCVVAGAGDPVLMLHQTPRSWDEYRDVLPLLGRRRRAIAMDTVGFGDSTPLQAGGDTVERWAAAAVGLLDALGVEQASIVGHHTGGYIATEIAAAYPERVSAAVLSSIALHTREERLRHASGRAAVDDVDPSLDGSHLVELWRARAAFYPRDIDLLERFMVDCLKAGPLAAEGHRIVARYALEERVPLLTCPVLLVAATDDPHAYPALPALREALPHAEVSVIEGGMVPLPDQLPREFAAVVEAFLDRVVPVRP
jgi:pimeloyl-ACP methyl ester carboxylesterase